MNHPIDALFLLLMAARYAKRATMLVLLIMSILGALVCMPLFIDCLKLVHTHARFRGDARAFIIMVCFMYLSFIIRTLAKIAQLLR